MVSIKQLTFATIIPSLVLSSSAIENSDSPKGSNAIANFPQGGLNSINGDIKFNSLQNGSVQVIINLKNLPIDGSPFSYHIHEASVPLNGSCSATLGHFNPNDGNKTECLNEDDFSLCELGDLTTRHGTLNSGNNNQSYIDNYLSLNPNNDYFFADGSKSITIHYKNSSRLACANIKYFTTANNNNDTSENGSNSTSSSSAPISTAIDGGYKNGLNGFFALAAGVLALLI